VLGGAGSGATSGTLGLWPNATITRTAATTVRIVTRAARSDTRFFNFAMFVNHPIGRRD
jgi:hypothetical protein